MNDEDDGIGEPDLWDRDDEFDRIIRGEIVPGDRTVPTVLTIPAALMGSVRNIAFSREEPEEPQEGDVWIRTETPSVEIEFQNVPPEVFALVAGIPPRLWRRDRRHPWWWRTFLRVGRHIAASL